jgi:arsenate reductase
VATTSILFICIGNSCRSPMAEAMARRLGGGRIEALSAGLAPTARIAAHTVSTLRRLGYPTEGLHSKGIDEIPLESVDVIVSLVGRHGLRLLPTGLTARREAWSIRDPYGDDEEVYRSVARALEARVRELVAQVLDDTGP